MVGSIELRGLARSSQVSLSQQPLKAQQTRTLSSPFRNDRVLSSTIEQLKNGQTVDRREQTETTLCNDGDVLVEREKERGERGDRHT